VAPSPIKNPEWIIGDTDALVQLVAADRLSPLKLLKSSYGIQTVITEPVEVELRRLMGTVRFRDAKHVLIRALSTGLLKTLDRSLLSSLVGSQAPSMFASIEREGEQLRRYGVGAGEAFSHAACMALGLPVLSNDTTAIRNLLSQHVPLQTPFLRSYDVLVFGVQIGNLSHNDCDATRQNLTKRGDGVHPCFRGRSFTDSLPYFYPRLIDGGQPIIGCNHPVEEHDGFRVAIVAK
jgi:hypothetical protein